MKPWVIKFFVGNRWCYDTVTRIAGQTNLEVLDIWWEVVNASETHDFQTEDGLGIMRVRRGSIGAVEIHP